MNADDQHQHEGDCVVCDERADAMSIMTAAEHARTGMRGAGKLFSAVCRRSVRRWIPLILGAAALAHPVAAGPAGLLPASLLFSGVSAAAALTSQTISFAALSGKTFGAAPFTVSATASSGLPVSFASLTASVCTVSGATVTIVAAGTCTIQASQAGSATYAPAPSVSRSFTVAKASQTITVAKPAGKTFGDAPFAVSATASSGLPVSLASTTPAVCTVSGSTVTIVSAGTCTIQASQAGNANFNAAPNVNSSFTVAKAAQTITFAALGGKTFGDPPFAVTATATSGQAVSFTSTTTAVCTVSGTTVTIVEAGTCTIRASQAGNANYSAAPNVNQSFAVAKASQTLSFGALPNQTLGAAPFTVSATASSGLPITFSSLTSSICTVSGNTVTLVAAGTCTIRAAQGGNANYTAATSVSQSFTIAKAAQTISFGALPNQTLGAAPFAVSATASSGLAVSFSSLTTSVCTVSGHTVTLVTGGTCTIRASQAGNASFLPAPNVDQSFTVSAAQASQTITFGALGDKTLGAAPFTVSATASSGLTVSFASLTAPVCTVSGSTVTLVAIGTCTIRASQAGNASLLPAPNVDQSFAVSAAQASQTITFGALGNKTLGASPFTVSATASSGLPVSFSSLTTGVCTVSGSTVTLVAVGTCTIRASQAGNASFLPAPNVDQSFTVAQASQTVTFGALANQTFGATPFTVSATASSGLPVSFASLTTPVCTLSGATVTLVSVGTCTIQASQAGNATYAAAPNVNQSFTVAQAGQTITFGALANQTLGVPPFSVSATASSGLVVTFSSTTTLVCTVSGNAVTLVAVGTCTIQASQAGNANYLAAPVVSRSFSVAGTSQAITFAALTDRTFGDAPFAVSATASSSLPVSFTSLTTLVCTASASTVTLVSAGTCTIQASQSGNATYAAASNVNQSFNVAKAAQSIAFTALSDKLLGSAPFTVSATASSGLPVSFASLTAPVCTLSGTTVTLLAMGTCTVQATQAGNANYLAATAVSQSFAVTASNQTITFAPLVGKTFGDAPFTVSATASSGLPVSFSSLTTAVCTISGSTVSLVSAGTCTIQASQAGNGTYAAAPNVSQSFTVAKASQSITFGALTNQTLGAAPFTVSATASSSLPVNFSSLTTPVCTMSGSTVALVAVGTCTIQASQVGNANYSTATSVNQSFTVASALLSQTITFGTLANQTLGAAPFTVSATASSGLAVSFGSLTTPVCTVSGNAVTLVAVGTCTIQASQAGNANYAAAANVNQSFTVTSGLLGQTITFGVLGNMTFGAAPFAVSATASSGLPVSFSSLTTPVCTISGSTVTLVSAGICAIQASQPGNGTYAAAPNATQSFTVAKASQTITFGALANQTLGAAPFTISATASSGLPVNFSSLTTPVCTVSGSTVTLVAVGSCTIDASQAGNASFLPATNADQSFPVMQSAQLLSFAAAVNYATGDYPKDIAIADLNGDGKADLVVVNANSYTVSLFVGNGDGTFVAGTTLSTGASPARVAVGDFNGDGKPDLVITNFVGNSVTLYLGNGNGTFGAASTMAVGLAPFGIAATDLNGDGKLDLVVTNGSSGSTVGQTVTVLLGNGNGTFQTPRTFLTGTNPSALAVGDLNGDGKLDLVVTNAGSNNVSVLLGNGDGTFGPQASYATGVYPQALALVDLNGDGKLDLAVANSSSNSVSILLGRGDGTFAPAPSFAAGLIPDAIAAGDFDGDGKVDIAVADAFDNVVLIFQGNGDGTFRPARTLATGLYPAAIAVGDLNGDGRVDLAVSNYFSKSMSVLLNGTTLNSAATVTAQAGTPQSAVINTAYATALSVVVRDAANAVIPGATVSFTAPIFGASGVFPVSGSSAQATTDAFGVATAPTLTANGTAGGFSVIARFSAASASFALTNATATHAPLFTSAVPPNGTINVPYDFTVTASGTPTPTFSVLPNSLPTGLSLNGTSGAIAGTPSVQGTFAGTLTAANGLPPDATQTFAITIASFGQTITFGALSNKTLGSAPFIVSATASSGLPVSFSSLTTSVCTVSGATVTLVTVGTCTIRASQVGDTTYSAAPNVDQSFAVIVKLNQTITFGALTNLTIGAPPLMLSATASSGLPVSLSSLTTPVCTVGGSTVTTVAVGGCTIRASQAGDVNYAPAPDVDQSFTITTVGVSALFAPPVTYQTDYYPLHIAVADLNGDGKLDLVVLDSIDVSVYLGNGDGTFAPRIALRLQVAASNIAIDDFNGDGIPDLAITSLSNSSVTIYPGKGDGTFKTPLLVSLSGGQYGIAAGDLNGDGKPDFVVTTDPSGSVGFDIGVVLSNGNGTFQPPKFSYTGGASQAVAIGDFNGDGKPDVAVGRANNNGVAILLGHADGTFTRLSPDTDVFSPLDLFAADLDGDGKLDLVVRNSFGVQILLGHGDGTFAPAVFYATGSGSSGVAVGDFNGDGKLDLAVTNWSDNNLAVLLGNGDGTFKPALLLAAGSKPDALGRGDLNGDGKPDLAITSSQNNSVSVLLNVATGDPPATITAKTGSPQSAVVSTAYPTLLSVVVRDAGSHPLPGVMVTFTAPTSGAAGTFAGGKSTVHVATDISGVAVGSIFTANATAGTFTVVASVAGLSATFALTNTTTSQAPAFTSGPLPNGIYNIPYSFTLTASGSPSPAFSVTTNTLPAGLALSSVTGVVSGTPTTPGTYTGAITATNGVSPSATQTFVVTIAQVTQTISFAALADQLLDAFPFALIATASSGLPVTFSSLTAAVCVVVGNTVTLLANGTCTIHAAQAGNAFFAAAAGVDRSFNVSAGNQAITFQPILPLGILPPVTSLQAGIGPHQLRATSSSGLPVSFASLTPVVCRIDGDWLTLLRPGTCSVRAAQAGDANYSAAPNVDQSVAVTPAYQQVMFWQPGTQSMLHPQVLLNAAASSGLPVSFSTQTPSVCTVSGGVATLLSGGTCTIVATQAGSADFSAASNSVSFPVLGGGGVEHVVPPIPGPFIEYSTLLGGGYDLATDVAVGPDGSAYVVGSVAGADFPGLSSTTFTNGGQDLLYAAKLNPSRGQLDVVTAVGARSPDMTGSGVKPIAALEGMAIDASGNVYVPAYANGRTFPITGGTYSRTGSPSIYRVGPDGSVQALGYAIDPAVATVRALAVDSAGSVYFTGIAGPGLATTANAAISTAQAPAGGPYLIKLAPDGNATSFATYLSVPGSRPSVPSVPHDSPCSDNSFGNDRQSNIDAATTAYAMVVDAAGNTYLAGQAAANDFPVTSNAPDTTDDENRDAFVAKVNPTGTALAWVARLGEYDAERATSIALAPDGSVVVGGKTATCNFSGWGAFQNGVQFAPGQLLVDREFGFVGKLAADGSRWIFVAAIGAGGGNLVRGAHASDPSPMKVAVDQTGVIYAAGSTVYSGSLPLGGTVFDPFCLCNVIAPPPLAFDAGEGAFLMKIAPDGNTLSYSVILGQGGTATGLALDNFGAAYVVGYGGAPPLVNAGQAAGSAFVAKVVSQSAPVILTTAPNPSVAGQSVTLAANVGDARWPGSIEFRDGAQLLATVPVASGAATFSTTFPVGIRRLNAVFRGSGPFANAAAPEAVQVINQVPAGP